MEETATPMPTPEFVLSDWQIENELYGGGMAPQEVRDAALKKFWKWLNSICYEHQISSLVTRRIDCEECCRNIEEYLKDQ